MARRLVDHPAWTTFARELGHNLNRAREAAGLSQERLAAIAGISTDTYRKYEKGESKPHTPANPQLVSLVAVSQALGVPLLDLLPTPFPDMTVGR